MTIPKIDDLALHYPREFAAWQDMIRRCYDPTHPDYPNEGGKGVRVSEPWRNSFSAFLADMGPMPDPAAE